MLKSPHPQRLSPIDELTEITDKQNPKCMDPHSGHPVPCNNLEDFRRNGITPKIRLGQSQDSVHVEYMADPKGKTCGHGNFTEYGLDFWKGRCNKANCKARVAKLENAKLHQ